MVERRNVCLLNPNLLISAGGGARFVGVFLLSLFLFPFCFINFKTLTVAYDVVIQQMINITVSIIYYKTNDKCKNVCLLFYLSTNDKYKNGLFCT